MVIQWKKFGFKINEFYEPPSAKTLSEKADVHAYFQQTSPVQTKEKMIIHRQALHLCIDLNQSEETLMKEMSKSARYSVRRAIRDQIQIKYIDNPTLTDIENFTTFYNQFAEAKGIEPCKLEKLIGLMKAELLYLTYAQDENGVSLGGSALICNGEIAIGLYGASIRFDDTEYSGQYISRANRFLHHSEVMHFKGKGCHTYDLMSLSTDKDDKEFQKINDYKRKLGGEERIIYSSLVPKNLKGYLLIFLLKIYWRKHPDVIKIPERAIVQPSKKEKVEYK